MHSALLHNTIIKLRSSFFIHFPSLPGDVLKQQNLNALSPDPSASALSIIPHFLPLYITTQAPYFALVLFSHPLQEQNLFLKVFLLDSDHCPFYKL